jgi:hypothetical protein
MLIVVMVGNWQADDRSIQNINEQVHWNASAQRWHIDQLNTKRLFNRLNYGL